MILFLYYDYTKIDHESKVFLKKLQKIIHRIVTKEICCENEDLWKLKYDTSEIISPLCGEYMFVPNHLTRAFPPSR